MSKERLYLFDTTLARRRADDGRRLLARGQAAIAAVLDELGVDYIEGGYPGANATDTQLFAAEPRASAAPPSPPSA